MIQLEIEQLVAAFDALDSGVVVLDARTGESSHAGNYWFASATDISSEHAVGKTLDELFPARPLTRLTTSIAEALTSLGSSALLTNMRPKTSASAANESGLTPNYNVSVRPFGERPYSHCLLQISDVTGAAHCDPHPAGASRTRGTTRLSKACFPDAILTLDADGLVQFANSASATRNKL